MKRATTTKPTLRDYIKNHFLYLNKNLKRYEKDHAPEHLHQARVQMKKLRAVLSFIETQKKYKDIKKAETELRTIFRKAGEIRQLRLQMKWLEENATADVLKEISFSKKLQTKEKRFRNQTNEYKKIIQKAKNNLLHKTKNIETSKIRNYIRSCYNHVIKLKPETNDTWHELRKKIKLVLYVQHWLPATSKPVIPVATTKKLHVLEQIIGKWHDIIAVNTLIGDMVKKTDPDLKTNFSELQSKCDEQIKKYEQEMKKGFRKILTGAKS